MTTTAPPTTNLERNLAFLTEHADLFAEHADHITALSAGNYDVRIQVDDESTALDLAVSLGTTGTISAPVALPSDGTFAGFTRAATLDGIRVDLTSCWMLTKAAA